MRMARRTPPRRAALVAALAGVAMLAGLPCTAQQATAKVLTPYTTCYFPDGLTVASANSLSPDEASRTVETADGSQHIDPVTSEQVMFAYPFTDFFANVKVEELPAAQYPALKKILVANLEYLGKKTPNILANDALPANLHGFEVHGHDLERLESSVLGMYVMFDDASHVVTTVFFLNQESWRRKFQSMGEYRTLRDHFLTTYTGCVRENQAITKPAAKAGAKRR